MLIIASGLLLRKTLTIYLQLNMCYTFLRSTATCTNRKEFPPMEDRLAVISCIISDPQSVSVMNEKLHLHASMIIARLGVPCREYGVSVVSVVLHGTQNEISSFAGDLGKVKGVKVKSSQVPVNSTSD